MPGPLDDLAAVGDLTKLLSGDQAAAVQRAQRAVRSYCGWHIAPAFTETLKLDGDGSNLLFLPSLKIGEIVSVVTDGRVVDLDQVDDSEAGYLQLNAGCWSPRPGKTFVVLTHGYENAPEDVVAVVTAVAARAIDSPSGRTREHAGEIDVGFALVGTGVSGGIALLEHEKAILDRYRVSS
ncbi:hypothetical protein ASD11_01235 [Aeromicrobium sp. Root495]|uniref:hypothetical protein n=1 Tax=Aeromicrobium sp. Root495 TaxID=1736550 RepID=UPI0006FE21FF|nr:hypothetical protein [Aeromicrobium sp. Root495]KQY58319.1 hypothetical protein ASD11_01235 [Aeromicrobium sp. Root495]